VFDSRQRQEIDLVFQVSRQALGSPSLVFRVTGSLSARVKRQGREACPTTSACAFQLSAVVKRNLSCRSGSALNILLAWDVTIGTRAGCDMDVPRHTLTSQDLVFCVLLFTFEFLK
jgi:hypothetical protein